MDYKFFLRIKKETIIIVDIINRFMKKKEDCQMILEPLEQKISKIFCWEKTQVYHDYL